MNILEVKNLRYDLAGKGGGGSLLSQLELNVSKGELITIRGASGSGKTTLARILAGELKGLGGSVQFYGNSRSIQLIPQEAGESLTPRRKVISLLREGILFYGLEKSEKEADKKIFDWLPEFGLEPELLEKKTGQLSGGEQQRVAWLRALLLEPELLILDEPTSQLDVIRIWNLLELFQHLHQQKKFACIWISHDPYVLKFLGGTSYVLCKGRLRQEPVLGAA